jgi:hypothetical protein
MNQTLADNEKRLISYFKQFMEKSIVPTIKNYGMVMSDWQTFSNLISSDTVDLAKIQSFLENKSSTVKMFPSPGFIVKKDDDKNKGSSGFLKKKDDVTAQ